MRRFVISVLFTCLVCFPCSAQYSAGGGTATGFNSVAIGPNASAINARSVVIGADSDDNNNTTFGSGAPGSRVVIGWDAKGYSWRTVSIGEKTVAGFVSATSVGANAFTGKAHDVALGRGAYNPDQATIDRLKIKDAPHTILGGSQNNRDINVYFSNTWANNWDTPPTGVSIGSTTTPSAWAVILHGRDALDARVNATQGATDGGHLQLAGGASTGSAEGGRVEISTTPGLESQPNCKNDRVVAAHFDASRTEDTRFTLLDNRTGQLRRVEIAKVKLCCGLEKDVLCLSGPPVEDN